MKINKRWVIAVIVLASLSIFFTQVNSVRATFGDVHAVMVLLRVETEILQKTPAGQYYESLFWKYNDELIEITNKYPEHRVEFSRVTRMFVPELEALLDGNGDTVYITPQHIEILKAELAWFESMGSESLRDAIQRELQRFPLDQFIGMTMSEAQDFVNMSWTPNSTFEKLLVPGSDGKWAYYIQNGVYFEYPGSYNLQFSESKDNFIYLIPTTGTPEQWDPCVVKVRILNVSVNEKDIYNPRSWYSSEHIVWETNTHNAEFPGDEFATSKPGLAVSSLHAFQYNDENQLGVHIWVFLNENHYGESLDYTEMINQRYPYFQHMINSVRVWKP